MHECVCSFNKCKLVCWFYWSVWSITNCQVGKKAEKHSNLWFPIINNDRSSCYELYNGTSDAFRFWMNSCVCGSDLDIELVNSTFLLQPYFSIALLLSLLVEIYFFASLHLFFLLVFTLPGFSVWNSFLDFYCPPLVLVTSVFLVDILWFSFLVGVFINYQTLLFKIVPALILFLVLLSLFFSQFPSSFPRLLSSSSLHPSIPQCLSTTPGHQQTRQTTDIITDIHGNQHWEKLHSWWRSQHASVKSQIILEISLSRIPSVNMTCYFLTGTHDETDRYFQNSFKSKPSVVTVLKDIRTFRPRG